MKKTNHYTPQQLQKRLNQLKKHQGTPNEKRTDKRYIQLYQEILNEKQQQ